MTDEHQGPWWASGASADDGIDGDDPFASHRRARGDGPGARDGASDAADGRWMRDAVDAVLRFASQAGRHVAEEPAPQAHPDDVVCDACPVCLTLRAVRQVRPEVIGHLSDAAHHLSLALRAVAEAQAGEASQGFERIDLDP